ncbi:ABC transporter permease [Bifidobacterium tibiigranuli]|jgi:putative ABC transport system permease protein|uniref:ABC transporter permease n=1 Tax=Bifidobacterium tibiigranuli TaxID=2172043 RepID=UPI0026F05A57|nr:ABC transporter permease [Bifidobacterium tibiigranuli]MCI1650668.1 ABC transporter permease [Bifidobacterium tibiigranuli]MCI2185956.1 ABC transporter permease [Bifidobacterium tibiigranuli]MCI2204839.1 ABC transporter permease [Bifidobacterium tibiigranuli]
MGLGEIFSSAFRSIASNLTRAALTLLGVLIGVGSVILLVGVGSGASASVTSRIEGLGTNIITVSSGMSRYGNAGGGSGSGSTSAQSLTMASANALQKPDAAPDVAQVVPQVSTSTTVAYGSQSTSTQVLGVTPNYFTVTDTKLAQGTAFQTIDNTLARNTAVIGADLAQTLFGSGDNAVGKTITVDSTPFTVYGVMAEKDTTGGSSVNEDVIVPIARAQRSLTGYGNLSSLTLQAKSTQAVNNAAAEATDIIAGQMGIQPADATFTVTTQSELLSTTSSMTSSLTTMLAAIAAISLVVGGIGVTNIMLVTVSERTREIGIRKALGAPRWVISLQFIIEATILSTVGGLLGVGTAFALSSMTIADIKPVITLGSVALAFGVSVAIGIIFGGYPAIRASSLKPVKALRHE